MLAETAAAAITVPELSPSARTTPAFREVFADGEFRAIWLAELASIAGDQFARVALTVAVFRHTGLPGDVNRRRSRRKGGNDLYDPGHGRGFLAISPHRCSCFSLPRAPAFPADPRTVVSPIRSAWLFPSPHLSPLAICPFGWFVTHYVNSVEVPYR